MHPILLHIGSAQHGYDLHTFGVLMVLGFASGILLAMRRINASGIPGVNGDTVLDIAVWMIIIGLICARLLFVLIGWKDFSRDPASIVKVWEGGISFHGGLIGGIATLVVLAKRKKLPLLKLADLFAPSVMLAYAIGRVGCFFNGCCYGVPTTMAWGVRFFDNGRWTAPSHPTQLYATGMSLVFLGLLFWLDKRKSFDGQIAGWYLVLAGIERFIMEIWRAGVTSDRVFMGFTDTQLWCVGIIICASTALVVGKTRSQGHQNRMIKSVQI